MNDRRPQLQAGFVLHHRPYRDSSLVLHVFSRDQGRLALVARGARRPKARQRGLLQAFRPLLLSWRLGGEMGTLTAVESDGAAYTLHGDRLLAGFYVNELVLRLCGRHDPHPELYDCYRDSLAALAGEEPLAMVLRRFEKAALACLGYGLPLAEHCLDGSAIDPDRRYRFDVEAGAQPLPPDETERGYSGRTLLALLHDDWSDGMALTEARHLLAAALSPHLGGQPLKTAQVLKNLRRRGLSGGTRESSSKGE